MGEKQNVEVALYAMASGSWEKLDNVRTFPEDDNTVIVECGELPFDQNKDFVVYGNFAIHKSLRCQSRKRFIKLLMSKGISRDCAACTANIIRDSRLSYSDAWFKLIIFGGF